MTLAGQPGARSFETIMAGAAPRRPARLGTTVLLSLVDKIMGGELPPESSLPTEATLCEVFGVSRTVIREALKLLEAKGLVRVKQGQGTTVEPTEQWDLLDPLILDTAIRYADTFEILDDVIDVRVGLECQMTRRAAEMMTDAQLRETHQALMALERLLDQPEEYRQAEGAYHDLILRGSGNRLGRSIIRSLQPRARTNFRYRGAGVSADHMLMSHRGHVAIYERLAARDPDGASAEMREHILGSWLERKSGAARSQDEVKDG
ncbi:MAG: FadR/GntR family transcriptional regulator [Acidimicrobiales bacterium]